MRESLYVITNEPFEEETQITIRNDSKVEVELCYQAVRGPIQSYPGLGFS